MDNVIQLNDPFSYILEQGPEKETIVGVQRRNRDGSVLELHNDGFVGCYNDHFIPKHELKQLMIMWLALNYPDVVNWDE